MKFKRGCRLQATGYRELFVYLYGYVYEKRKKLEWTASKGGFGGLILDGGVGRERSAGIGRLGPVGAR